MDCARFALKKAHPTDRFIYLAITGNWKIKNKPIVLSETERSLPFFPEVFAKSIKQKIILNNRIEQQVTCSFWTGTLRHGMRLFHKKKLSERDLKTQKEIIKGLNTTYKTKGRGKFWVTFLKDIRENPEKCDYSNLGIKGHLGILIYLSLCYEQNISRKVAMKLLEGAIHGLLDIDRKCSHKGLPAWGFNGHEEVFLSNYVCGDFISGYVLVLAGKRCKKPSWVNQGRKIFERKLDWTIKELVGDKYNFSSGSIGLAHLCWRYLQLVDSAKVQKKYESLVQHAQKVFFKEFYEKEKIYSLEKIKVKTTPDFFTSSLGLDIVLKTHRGEIGAGWDSMLGLSNPVTHKVV